LLQSWELNPPRILLQASKLGDGEELFAARLTKSTAKAGEIPGLAFHEKLGSTYTTMAFELKIRNFHSSHLGTPEYNANWSRECGVIPNPDEERNCLPHVEAHESASDP
jgi:hypothetical protein